MRKHLQSLSLIFVAMSLAFAFQAQAQVGSVENLIYQGRIANNGTALNSGVTTFELSIFGGAANCLLYRETFTKDMAGSSGHYSFPIGGGTRTDTLFSGMAPTHTLSDALRNIGTISGLNCGGSSGTFSPALTNDRRFQVRFNPGSGWVSLPSQAIKSAPYAMQAMQVNGYGISNLAKIGGAGASDPMSPAGWAKILDYSELGNIILGTAAAVTCDTSRAGGLRYNAGTIEFCNGTAWGALSAGGSGITALTGDVTASGTGSVAATISNDAVTYAKLQNISATQRLLGRFSAGAGDAEELTLGSGLNLSGTGVLSLPTGCASTEILKWNGTAWACAADATGTSPGDASYAAKGIVQFDTNAATSGLTVAAGVARLANSGVTAGTYGSATQVPAITVDAFGRVTSATATTIALPASAIASGTLNISQGGTGASSLTANRMVMVNGTGTALTNDSCTAGQVLQYDGTQWSCVASSTFGSVANSMPNYLARVSTTANISLSGTQTIDGVAVVAGDRVVVRNQTTWSQNGVYVVAAGAWSRATDMDTWNEAIGYTVQVTEGTAWAGMTFVSGATVGGTLGTTNLEWISRGAAINSSNIASGSSALLRTTTGNNNIAIGLANLVSNTTGSVNTGVGIFTLQMNTIGDGNTGVGAGALSLNTTGANNSAYGRQSLQLNTTGSNNSAVGYRAGSYIADGTTANATSSNSVYLGADSKASADASTNEIVIGHNAIGNGSNSVTLGNTSVTRTVLRGNVGIGTTTPAASSSLDITSTTSGVLIPRMTTTQRDAIATPANGLQVYNTTTNQLNYYNGSSWQALGVAGAGISSLTAGTGLTGGTITTSGTIAVDTGTTANKIVQLNASAELPAVSGVNLTNLNASNIASGTLAAARLPNSGVTAGSYGSATQVPAITVDAYGRVTAATATNIALSAAAITSGTLDLARGGTGVTSLTANRMVMVNGTGTTLTNDACTVNQVLQYNGTTWACVNGSSLGSTSTVLNGGNSFAGTMTVGTNDNNELRFETNGTDKMTVLANGNVGIGSSNPSRKLHIDGNSAGLVRLSYDADNPAHFLELGSGNGGAGTPFFEGFYDNNSVVKMYYSGIGVGDGVRATRFEYGTRSSSVTDSNYPATLLFAPRGLASSSPTLFLDSTGRIGVGTTSPRSRLEVAGGIQIADDAATCDATKVGTIRYNSSTIQFCNGSTWAGVGGGGGAVANGGNSFASTLTLGTNDNNELRFETNGTDKMTMLANGNVGIGNTNPTAPLEVFTDNSAGKADAVKWKGAWSSYTLGALTQDPVSYGSGALELYQNGTASTRLSGLGNSFLMGGNVGIGTTSPTQLLHISKGTGSDNLIRLEHSASSTNWYLGQVATGGNFAIGQTTTPAALSIQNITNFVGVGTSSPQAPFDMNGSFRVYKPPTNNTATLTADIAQGNTTANVSSTTGFADSGLLAIRDEIFSYSGKTATSFTGLVRNLDGGGTTYGYSGDTLYQVQSANFDNTGALISAVNNDGSFSAGSGAVASRQAIALGNNAKATGYLAVSLGGGTANGNYSYTMGPYSSANSSGAYSIGYGTVSSAEHSYAIGFESAADTFKQTVVGTNAALFGGSTNAWVATDPVFTVGNGASSAARSTAMTVLKNGKVGIGTTAPMANLDISAPFLEYPSINLRQVNYDNGLGGSFWPTSTALSISGGVAGSGGSYITGFGYGWTPPVVLGGVTTSTMNGTLAAVQIQGQSRSGTSTTFVANGERVMQVRNHTTELITVLGNGNTGIGSTAPSEKLHVVGNLRVQGSTDCTLGNGSGATMCSSDERLKTNIEIIPDSLQKILSLRGVSFDWNEKARAPGKHEIGVIAQDVEKVFPTAVATQKETGYKMVDYAVLVAPLIESVKTLFGFKVEQDKVNVELKTQVRALASENEKLKEDLKQMQDRMLLLEKAVLKSQSLQDK